MTWLPSPQKWRSRRHETVVEIAGPERVPFNEMVARYLKAIGDLRTVVSDPEARYFGGRVEERRAPLGEACSAHRFQRMAPPLTGKNVITCLCGPARVTYRCKRLALAAR